MNKAIKTKRVDTLLEDKTTMFIDGHSYRKQHFVYVAVDNPSQIVYQGCYEFVRVQS